MGDAGATETGQWRLASTMSGAPAQSSWNVYFGVADVDAATAHARNLGAQVAAEP